MDDTPLPVSEASTLEQIQQQLTLLRGEVKDIRLVQQRHEQREHALLVAIDRFLAAELDLTGTLAQVREVVGANRDEVADLRAAARLLKRTIETTLQLAAGDPGLLLGRERAA